MALKSCDAIFTSYAVVDDISRPDIYHFECNGSSPDNSFVISRTKDGEVLSLYGDEVWDLRPYRLAGDTGSAKIRFINFSKALQVEAKWIFFLFIYLVDSGRATGLSIATLMCYFKVVRRLTFYAGKQNSSLKSILEKEAYLIKYASSTTTSSQLDGLSKLIRHLISIGYEASGYRILISMQDKLSNEKVSSFKPVEQHPVIPPRLYAKLIAELDSVIDYMHENKDKLEAFLVAMRDDKRFARSHYQQRKVGCKSRDFGPCFLEASETYGLDTLFCHFGVKNIPTLGKFIMRVRHGCRMLIHVYTGMRNSEALSLKVNCLEESSERGRKVLRFTGETSKFIGQKKKVSWVTSKEVLNAYELAVMFARVIGDYIKLPPEEVPLNISLSYLLLASKHKYDGQNVLLNFSPKPTQEIYKILDLNCFRILDEDISHLERVNPFRAWEAEKVFARGSSWRFTTHQFRRSLAFYVSQSSLVSLPSLKRQFKHISREMTLYYCQNKYLDPAFDYDDHISRLMKREKPLADATAYISQVLMSDEQLFGAHGKFVEKNLGFEKPGMFLEEKRIDLVRRFKAGEIAYKETPLGACTTIKPCDKKVLREIAACVSCDRAVIKLSKLSKTIKRQELFVAELKQLNPMGVEYRYEKAELDILINYQTKAVVGYS